jgi:hypothetical protein
MSDLEKTGPIPPMNLGDMEKTGPVSLSARSEMDKTGPVALSARSEMDKTGPIPAMSEMHKTGPVHAMNKTSSVPLKKETVRVTLKANPEAPRAETPNVEGTPSVVAAGPPPPSAPPKPPVIAAPAPTIRLKTAGGGVTGTPAPAPTVRLNTGANLAGAPTVPLQTRPLVSAPPVKGATMQLPKATVQLNPTKPLGPPSAPGTAQIGTMHVVDDEETERLHKEATTIAILSVFAFVASVALLAGQIMTWISPDALGKANEIGDLFN